MGEHSGVMNDKEIKELERQDMERGKLLKKVLAGNIEACIEYLEKYGGKKYRLDDNARRLVFTETARKTACKTDRKRNQTAPECLPMLT